MRTADRLKEAARKGLIQESNIESLNELLSQDDLSEQREEDSLKFLASYSDFFISVGLILFSIAVLFAGLRTPELTTQILITGVLALGLLAYWLVKKQRRMLSGLVINVAIAVFLFNVLAFDFINLSTNEDRIRYAFGNVYKAILISGILLTYFMCFKLPSSLGIFMLSCFWTVYLYYYSSTIVFEDWHAAAMFLLFGLLTFSIAMWQDIKDIKREKINSDYAFWLHSASAPMILFGVITLGLEFYGVDYSKLPVFVFSVLPFFIVIAIFIDRRSILVSSVVLVIYLSFRYLEARHNLAIDQYLYWVLGFVGALVIFIGGLWYKIRNILFSKLKDKKISQYVPPFTY